MQEQASVVEVDRTDRGDAVVGHEALRVDEAGRVLVDLDAAAQQHLIEAARHAEDDLLVRDAGHDDANVDAAVRGRDHRVHQVVAKHEVGREEPRVARALGEQVDVELVARGLAIEGRVVIAEDVAVRLARGHHEGRISWGAWRVGALARRRQLRRAAQQVGRRQSLIALLAREGVPERHEHVREATHRLAGQAKTDVLPVPVATLEVDVAIR